MKAKGTRDIVKKELSPTIKELRSTILTLAEENCKIVSILKSVCEEFNISEEKMEEIIEKVEHEN